MKREERWEEVLMIKDIKIRLKIYHENLPISKITISTLNEIKESKQ